MALPESGDAADARTATVGMATLEGLARVLSVPLPELADHFSSLIRVLVDHTALVLLAEDDVSQPRKASGAPDAVAVLTRATLEAIRANLLSEVSARLTIQVSGERRTVLAMVAETGALLVLVDAAEGGAERAVLSLWRIVALRIQEFARQASPGYLFESRMVSSIRAEAVAELADQHATTLESLLSVLRSTALDDRAARQTAGNLATAAAVQLRTASDRVRTADEEPVTHAFGRLKNDLEPLLRYRDVDVQFVEPPVDGRPLPSEVAHGARAMVRGAILALVDQPNVSRIRVQWDCDGKNLLIEIRDDATAGLTSDSEKVQPLTRRILALRGSLNIATTDGWGSEMSVVLPLDPPTIQADDLLPWGLAPRELEVVELMVCGLPNRAIAKELGISENTVKFHLSKIFRKLGVTSRSQATAKVMQRQGALQTPVSLIARR